MNPKRLVCGSVFIHCRNKLPRYFFLMEITILFASFYMCGAGFSPLASAESLESGCDYFKAVSRNAPSPSKSLKVLLFSSFHLFYTYC